MTEPTTESYWALTEENEWEGETWIVYFPVPEELLESISKLQELIEAEEDSAFELTEVEELPREEDLDTLDYGASASEEDEDYDDYDESNSYFHAESIGVLKASVLAEALNYDRNSLEGDDPLYKLGLFR